MPKKAEWYCYPCNVYFKSVVKKPACPHCKRKVNLVSGFVRADPFTVTGPAGTVSEPLPTEAPRKLKAVKMPRVRFNKADCATMEREGWSIFLASHDEAEVNEIERIDSPDDDRARPFVFDDDAIAHVMRRALAGSPMHVKALVVHCIGCDERITALLKLKRGPDDYEDAIDLLRRARAVVSGDPALEREINEFLEE